MLGYGCPAEEMALPFLRQTIFSLSKAASTNTLKIFAQYRGG
jgi:hypothetical protein